MAVKIAAFGRPACAHFKSVGADFVERAEQAVQAREHADMILREQDGFFGEALGLEPDIDVAGKGIDRGARR